jgi:3D-(3,5/4)-trihydroxycyclohexane-1,2-dione acylhydrolase (decyclizing)
VDHPHRGGPYYLLLPMNVQPAAMPGFNLDELPVEPPPRLGAAAGGGAYARAAEALLAAQRVVVRVGGGARQCGAELLRFLDLVDGVAIVSPLVSGIIPYAHPRNMLVAGSKGSPCGNYAMEQADLLVAIGSRFVCQSDSSRTGYRARQVININTDLEAATHYNRTIALVGDAGPTLARLNEALRVLGAGRPPEAGNSSSHAGGADSAWLASCRREREQWEAFKAERYAHPTLHDPAWGGEVLTQPAAIKVAADWARAHDAVALFDAGDVQANGFQIVEDDRPGRTYSETGASYMGWAVSALLATALASRPFYGLAISGDGAFTMNPQILIDGVAHGARGCILLLDNRRMAAISGLQMAQYGAEYATGDGVAVDYVAWARAIPGVAAFHGGRTPQALEAALAQAHAHPGLSLVHLPVYYGPDPLGGLGAYGRWNVGNWVEDTQRLRHDIGL